MSRVITFSTVFPSYHPRSGEPTYFVEKILHGLIKSNYPGCGTELLKQSFVFCAALKPDEIKPHTIRGGHRWKVGDKFSPRIWSGKPYRSPQIQFAPDIEIKKIWNFSFLSTGIYRLGERQFDGEVESHHELLELIAHNDGLTKNEFLQWFKYPRFFDGQIICWNENINY